VNFLILHGTLGSPDGNWFPWLAGELEKLGHKTLSPQLPTPEGQTPANWVNVISSAVEQLGGVDNNLVIVAHSRSPLAVCRYLQTVNTSVSACFFVAGFAERFPIMKPYDDLNYPFDDLGADWNKVKAHCSRFICFAGDNDPYVPMPAMQNFASHLSAELIIVPGAGHFNTSSGYIEFPQLLEKIKTLNA
jgi:uncharacterized protein